MKNFLFALRYLRKLRGGTLARVVSLSLGLAVGLLVFSYANYNLSPPTVVSPTGSGYSNCGLIMPIRSTAGTVRSSMPPSPRR